MALSVPLERIEQQARQADPRRAALAVVLFLPFLAGWIVRKAWMSLVYLWSAVVAGWHEAGRPRAEGGHDERR
ncbi:hypothetical protein [Micrococcus luteus]|uniref:hypothetical protein n=1 Tax=Micrococcus luteus TaxID=1270 RepID=UPI0033212907